MRAVIYSALMFFEFFICYCFPAQELMTQSKELPDILYCTNWYRYQKHSKDVLTFLGKCQVPITLNVGGMVELDLRTAVAALKTMVSYSMFLRTMTLLSEG
ncbi:unnamed protein product [Acanthoscelides obtectus]|nr:unnamed protein product [Acanthoscelides obtectus]CAH2009456.1 unnamed protein product [Acanthoscelides obtectus]CAK1677374.1 hypothetical protein AOBTE_LOCUS31281 [Acanthoscelides obtectus]CAK1677402.1 hypothetical protein AOBTE_LOCUS31293 [Acanthoscelides obtectus]